MDPADLERLLDRALTELPPPRAPRTLLTRVMTAVAEEAARPAPAPATGWSTWSRAWQSASIAALAVLAAGLWWLAMAPPAGVTEVTRAAGETATVMRVFWNVMLQPIATYVFALGILLAFACAAAWAALEVALGGATHR